MLSRWRDLALINWPKTFEGLVSAGIPVAGFVYTYTVNRRAQYERVLALTAQVSTPPIADDRDVAGTAFEPTFLRAPGSKVTLDQDAIKAVYNVLWYFERAYAVYVSLRPPLGSRRITRSQALLLDTLASAIDVWVVYLGFTWVDVSGNDVDAHEVIPFLEKLAREHARLQEQRSRRTLFGRKDRPTSDSWP